MISLSGKGIIVLVLIRTLKQDLGYKIYGGHKSSMGMCEDKSKKKNCAHFAMAPQL